MVGTVPIRVAGFVLLASCAAFGQRVIDELPDAPSTSVHTETISTSAVPAWASGTGSLETAVSSEPVRASLIAVYREAPVQKESGDFFEKYLYPSLLKRHISYHPSTSSSLMGRATYAASTIFITRDETGKGRLNTPYLVGVLTSAVAHMAYRPYWNRSATTPFSDFGSTIGNDAGMNVLHEFAPGLQQLMKAHAPKFVTKIEQRVGR
jgi:hypothetical protein